MSNLTSFTSESTPSYGTKNKTLTIGHTKDCNLSSDCLPDDIPREMADPEAWDNISITETLDSFEKNRIFDIIFALQRLLKNHGILNININSSNSEIITVEESLFLLERVGFQLVNQRKEFKPDGNRVFLQLIKKNNEGFRPIDTIDSIIRNDTKVTTYKFAPLRAIGEMAGSTLGLVAWNENGTVSIPIEPIIHKWIEYYWSLLSADHFIYQGQKITGKSDITFRSSLNDLILYWEAKKDGWLKFDKALKQNSFDSVEYTLYKDVYKSIKTALLSGPVTYMGNGKTGKIFEKEGDLIRLPADLWKEFALMGRWFDDSIIVRWAEFSASNKHQPAGVNTAYIFSRLVLSYDYKRELSIPRQIYTKIQQEQPLSCVWTDKPLQKFDLDHAIPFAIWRNNALWNLFPADPKINNNKRDKLPKRNLLLKREQRIRDYWDQVYEVEENIFDKEVSLFIGDGSWSKDRSKELFQVFSHNIELLAVQNTAERWSP